jgi:hypothetical protein
MKAKCSVANGHQNMPFNATGRQEQKYGPNIAYAL